MISEVLIPLLKASFGDGAFTTGVTPNAIAVFPAKHPEVGSIEIFEDGNELTLVVGKFSHGHFGNFEKSLSEADRAFQISSDVVSFLTDIFTDRIEFWGSHSGAGGWRQRGARGKVAAFVFGSATHVWSGPIATRA